MDNNKKDLEPHKVFISYCWTNKEHEQWVYNLAERLVSNGVDVKYDKWDLKTGQDKYSFMESMVQDESIEKVLIICERGYKEKSDKREGGVGTEVQIITPELYGKVEQTKFIPIIAESGKEFDSYIPTFLKTRIGINMSSIECYEEGYDELLRIIYNRPKYTKPKLGVMPSYIDNKTESSYEIVHTINNIKSSILKRPETSEYYIQDFIPQFIEAMSKYEIEYNDLKEPYDEIIYNKIEDMRSLRNQYIEFFEIICKLSKLDIDITIDFFEKIYKYTDVHCEGNYFKECQFDHYKFFITELLLYTIAILLKYEMYEAIHSMVVTPYFVKSRFNDNNEPSSIQKFYFYIKSLENRNYRLSLNKLSYKAQLLVDRSTINNTDYSNDIIEADMILHYLTSLKLKCLNGSWFPILYVYKQNFNEKISIFKKLISKRYFEKLKALFGVKSAVELQKQLRELNEDYADKMRYPNSWETVPSIKWQIDTESIATFP